MVGATGFEPVTTRTPSVCATRLRYAPTAVLSCQKSSITPWLNQFKEFTFIPAKNNPVWHEKRSPEIRVVKSLVLTYTSAVAIKS